MPRPVGYGRPGTKVFPDDWATTHAAVLETTFDCTVVIGPGGTTPTWNEGAGATLSTPADAVYDGPASVTPVVQDSDQSGEMAEDVVPSRTYEVKILHATSAVAIGHFVTFVTSTDPMFPAGRRLKVTSVEKGSRRFSRILRAVDTD